MPSSSLKKHRTAPHEPAGTLRASSRARPNEGPSIFASNDGRHQAKPPFRSFRLRIEGHAGLAGGLFSFQPASTRRRTTADGASNDRTNLGWPRTVRTPPQRVPLRCPPSPSRCASPSGRSSRSSASRIKQELGLTETEFGLLIGTPILTGSLVRVVLGVWTDRFGGRLVYTATMLAAARLDLSARLRQPPIRQMLLAALGVGLAGGSFRRRRRLCLALLSAGRQGTALGIFGVGNVGAAVTKFLAPLVLLARAAGRTVALVWAAALAVMAVIFWFTHRGRSGRSAERRIRWRAARSFWGEFAALPGNARLALRLLLLLRLRRLRRAVAVAAALPDRRLRLRHRHGRHGRRRLFDPGQHLPRLWRRAVGQVRRPHGALLDLRDRRRGDAGPVAAGGGLHVQGINGSADASISTSGRSPSSPSPSCSASR